MIKYYQLKLLIGIALSIERALPALAGSASRGYAFGIPMLEAML